MTISQKMSELKTEDELNRGISLELWSSIFQNSSLSDEKNKIKLQLEPGLAFAKMEEHELVREQKPSNLKDQEQNRGHRNTYANKIFLLICS